MHYGEWIVLLPYGFGFCIWKVQQNRSWKNSVQGQDKVLHNKYVL